MVAAGGRSTGGSITVSGKWIASSRSSSSSRRTRPGATQAPAIAATRPGVERLARYERTTCDGSPSRRVGRDRRQEGAVVERADAGERAEQLADVRLRAPIAPGTSVRTEIPTFTGDPLEADRRRRPDQPRVPAFRRPVREDDADSGAARRLGRGRLEPALEPLRRLVERRDHERVEPLELASKGAPPQARRARHEPPERLEPPPPGGRCRAGAPSRGPSPASCRTARGARPAAVPSTTGSTAGAASTTCASSSAVASSASGKSPARYCASTPTRRRAETSAVAAASQPNQRTCSWTRSNASS